MLIFAYSIYIIFLLLLIVMFISESRTLDSIISEEKKYKVPIFNFGKKQNAFTIEEAELLTVSAVYKMSFMRRLYCKLAGCIFNVGKFYIWSKDIASRLAIQKLQVLNKEYDYFINYKINVTSLRGGYYIAEVSTTALKLYKDTLGLFQVPNETFKFKPALKRMHLVRNFFRNLLLMLILLIGIMYGFNRYSNFILHNLTYSDEEIMWSSMEQSSIIVNRLNVPNLNAAEHKINATLNKIIFSDKLQNYKFQVFIIDDMDPDLHLLPAGKIVITKGLLKQVSSEQELMFIVLDAIGHYENKSHIKSLGQNIITPYLLIKWFGADNFISRLALSYSGFYKQEFSSAAEIQTNEFALIQLQRIYEDIGSLSLLAENIIHEDYTYIKTHPVTVENLKMLMKANNLDEGEVLPLELNLDNPQINISPTNSADPDTATAYTEVEKRLNAVYSNYNDAIRPLMDILDSQGLDSKEGLEAKIKIVNYGIETVGYFEGKFAVEMTELFKYLDEEFAKEEDQDQARFDKATLIESIDDFENIMRFYFDRDLKLIKTQKNVLNFLNERLGTFTIVRGQFRFNSSYEMDNFNRLINKIKDLNNQKPKLKTDKWRNYG